MKGNQTAHSELPVRLAHRICELENLPHDLSKMPSVQRVKEWYTLSFEELSAFPKYAGPINDDLAIREWNDKFVSCVQKIKTRHDPTVPTVAQGVLELKRHWKETNPLMLANENGSPLPLPSAISSFLDRFYMSRIGIRMLIGQTIALHRDQDKRRPDMIGIICTKTKIGEIAREAAFDARYICSDYYGCWNGGPEVKFISETNPEFMYVPSQLHHVLFELLKNSLRAVVERHGADRDEWPEIKVVVAEGNEDITIKISDEGGGIPRSGMPLIWSYMYTTAPNPILSDDNDDVHYHEHNNRPPMAGFGYGLPISRLYARYFGGDLKVISMEGYGTDTYIHLSRLSDSAEPLP